MTRRFNVGDIVPWYTGIAEWKRQGRLAMAMQVYCDESGKNDGPVYVMAGVASAPNQWVDFANEWQLELDSHPPIRAFKMSKFKNSSRLSNFADIFHKHVWFGFAVSVKHDEYENIIKGRFDNWMDDPYMFLFDSIMNEIDRYTENGGYHGPIDFIFDEQLEKEAPLNATWAAHLARMPPEKAARFESRPTFAKDERALPLQAADMLAWHVRRALAQDDRRLDETSSVGVLIQSKLARHVHYDADYLIRLRRFLMDSFVERHTLRHSHISCCTPSLLCTRLSTITSKYLRKTRVEKSDCYLCRPPEPSDFSCFINVIAFTVPICTGNQITNA